MAKYPLLNKKAHEWAIEPFQIVFFALGRDASHQKHIWIISYCYACIICIYLSFCDHLLTTKYINIFNYSKIWSFFCFSLDVSGLNNCEVFFSEKSHSNNSRSSCGPHTNCNLHVIQCIRSWTHHTRTYILILIPVVVMSLLLMFSDSTLLVFILRNFNNS